MVKYGLWPITEAEADSFVGLSNSIKSLNHFLTKPCQNLS